MERFKKSSIQIKREIRKTMIDSRELRIGNFIQSNGKTLKVLGVKNEKVELDGYAHWIDLSTIEPIPLSEEVLLKSGAVLHGIEYIIKASALPMKIRFHSGIAYCEIGNVYLGDRIKYLHELQNLKYILCGVELEVKW